MYNEYYEVISDAKEIVGNWWYDTSDSIDTLMTSIDGSSIVKRAAVLTVLTLGLRDENGFLCFYMPSTYDSLDCFRFIKNRLSKGRKLCGDGIDIVKIEGHWVVVEGKAI